MAKREHKDHIGKRLFRNERLVADLLRGFVPARWTADLDYATLRPLPTEFVNRRGDKRIGDLLWLVNRKDESPVLVMIENEARVNRRMAARMMTNVGLLYESLTRRARGPDGRYPAVLPLVIHSGERPWTAAEDLCDLVGRRDPLAAFVAGRRFLPLDLIRLARDDLPSSNRMSVVVRVHNSPSATALADELAEAFEWIGEDEHDLRLPLLDWVYDVVLPLRFPAAHAWEFQELEQEVSMLAERAKQWTEDWFRQGKAQGIEQGKAQGIEQGKAQGIEQQRSLLYRQAARRFGVPAAERVAAHLAGASSPAQLEEVGDLIVDCTTEHDLLDSLDSWSDRRSG